MTRPMTDRERVAVLEARLAELEEQLRAWEAWEREGKGAAVSDVRFNAALLKIRGRYGGGQSCHGAVRLLLALLDAKGRTLSVERLLQAAKRPGQDDPEYGLVKVVMCRLRKRLKTRGFADVIQTIHGRGYFIDLEARERLLAWLGPVAAGEVSA